MEQAYIDKIVKLTMDRQKLENLEKLREKRIYRQQRTDAVDRTLSRLRESILKQVQGL